MSHLLGIQKTNFRLVYHTHTHVISRVWLGSEPGLLMFNEPWGLLNTKVMRHLGKRGLASSPREKKIKIKKIKEQRKEEKNTIKKERKYE